MKTQYSQLIDVGFFFLLIFSFTVKKKNEKEMNMNNTDTACLEEVIVFTDDLHFISVYLCVCVHVQHELRAASAELLQVAATVCGHQLQKKRVLRHSGELRRQELR